jgi:protoporphyrin/coproporphyrin ferrochelatase
MKKLAVVLFNLGGPDRPESVRPFLFNLFNDKAILRVPGPIRFLLAATISSLRAGSAKKNYAQMGGGSPLLPETEKQALALQEVLNQRLTGYQVRTFIAMRYWHPFTQETAMAVKAWSPDEVILLPLYPQFSTTTTASSLQEWNRVYAGPAKTVCCYPAEAGLVQAHADSLIGAWKEAGSPTNVRVLFSAHGLPERVVADGDPYQHQVERTCEAVKKHLPPEWEAEICYQSRVGPLKWIGPSTEDAIERAAKEDRAILVTPIAFVSEHIETLVELDVEYGELAHEFGARHYIRAPALGVADAFINALAGLVDAAFSSSTAMISDLGKRRCPPGYTGCPHRVPTRVRN